MNLEQGLGIPEQGPVSQKPRARNHIHFVSLADNFIVQLSNLLKPPSGMEDKTA